MSATPNIRGEKIFGSITGITLFSATTISGGTLYGDGSNLSGIIGGSGSSITGGTFDKNTSTLTFTNTSGGTFSVTGLTDIYTTGLTFNQSTYDLTIKLNDNSSVTQNLSVLASDVTITGGTYNPSNGVATFINNTGGTFDVSGFLTGFTDIYTTGGTYDNGAKTILFTRNDNNTYSVNLSSITSQDVYVSGGTYDNNTGTATFTNTSGGTFDVSGFTTGGVDVFVTGSTYTNNTLTFVNNTGGTFNVLFNTLTGATINGNLSVTGTTSSEVISATTYQNLPSFPTTNYVQLTANTTTTNLTYTDVPGISITLSSTGVYQIEIFALTLKGNNAGLNLGITVPTTSTYAVNFMGTGSANTQVRTEDSIASGSLSTVVFNALNGLNGHVRINALITTTTTGDVKLGFASVTSGTATIRTGTYMLVTKIA